MTTLSLHGSAGLIGPVVRYDGKKRLHELQAFNRGPGTLFRCPI